MSSPVHMPTQQKRRWWPKKKRWRFLLIAFIVIICLVIIAFGVGYWMLSKRVPTTEGTLTIDSLHEEVSVYRDENGVPHIVADNKHDLFIAQGFVTAQARLMQMDLSRRQASGTLSEVVGQATLSQDKFFRTLGLRRWAKKSLQAYSDHAKKVLKWYAQGVNAYIQHAKETHSLPIGFKLLGYTPDPWTPVDSLTIGKYMAFSLGGHWEGQAFRYYLLNNFSEAKAKALFPSYPSQAPTIISVIKQHPLDLSQMFAKAYIPNPFNGSNNWVVSGEKTASGYPYLANDPHLGLSTPSIWYETNLKTPNMNVSGVIFAGVPGIIVGHNQYIAWGVTNVGPDVQDLYIEKRKPGSQHKFLYKGDWYKAKVITETIKVKGQEPIDYKVTITRHGPVISDFAHENKSNIALAMKWTALQPTTELQAILKFMKAKNWKQFKEALTYFQAPAQNFVFASKQGKIAYRANGLIPIRKNGHSLLPVPGWTDKYEWTGYIPWDELPTLVNPDKGFIATANNKVVGEDYPYHISNVWSQPYRAKRITQVLSSQKTFTIKDMKQLQFDHKNLQAKAFLPIFLNQLQQVHGQKLQKDIYQQALDVLKQWQYIDNRKLSAPLIFNLWRSEISDVLFQGKIKKEMMDLFAGKAQVVDQMIRRAARGHVGPWMKEEGGFSAVVFKAFQNAIKRAEQMQGDNPKSWQWGDFHTAYFHHPLSSVKPLNLIFDPKAYPVSGSAVTVAAASWNPKTGAVNHGPAWRTIIDTANMSRSWNVVTPGQSGHVLSPWYDDQLKDWVNGQYHITSTDPDVFKKGADLLRLKPGSS